MQPGSHTPARQSSHRVDVPTRVAVRLPDYLGEMTMAEPAVRALAEAGFEVVAFGRPWTGDLLAGGPVRVESPGGRPETVGGFRGTGAGWGVTMRGSFSTALRMRLAGLKVVGRRGNLRSFLLHRSLPRRRAGHRIDEYLEVALAGIAAIRGDGRAPEVADGTAAPVLRPTPTHLAEAAARLRAAGVGERYFVCCPTAGHPRPSTFKLWPAFPEFTRTLLARGGEVVVCPGRGETAWYRAIPAGTHVLEDVGVGCLLGIVAGAAGVASNDTGTAHVAAAAGTPTMVLFGDTSPERYAARGPRVRHVGRLGRWPTPTEGAAEWDALLAGPR